MIDNLIWEGINEIGDTVTVYKLNDNGEYPISYHNGDKHNGYAGATTIPKEVIEKIIKEANDK